MLTIAAGVAAAADPALVRRIPSDTKVVVGVNVAGFSASPAAKAMFGQAQSAQPQLQQMAKSVGFDPLRDVTELLIASRGDQKTEQALVLVKATFDAQKLTGLAAQAGASARTYGGVPVFTSKETREGWLALLDNNILAYGDPASVKSVIDRKGTGTGPDPRLRARMESAERSYDFWFASTIPVSQLMSGTPQTELGGAALQGELLKAVEEISGGIKFGTDLVFGLDAVTRSDKDATALTDVIRFFAGMAQASAQKDPKTAQSLSFLDKLQMSTQGNTARISLAIPGAELDKIMQQAMSAATRQASPAKRAAAPAKAKPAAPPPAGGITIQSSPKDMGTVVVK